MARVAVVGGGIAGLSAAYDLCRAGRHEVTLIEASDRLGGKIVTYKHDGFVVEGGPDSIFTHKPWGKELIEELGLSNEIREPVGGGFSMLVDGVLRPVPRELASLTCAEPSVVEAAGFLDADARRRVLDERSIPRGDRQDETIASFFRRRFGCRFSRTLAEPLLAGVQAGDPELLSMSALYPVYLSMEQANGSLTGVRAGQSKSGSTEPRPPAFITLRGGLEQLVEGLRGTIGKAEIRTNMPLARMELRKDGSLRLTGEDEVIVDAGMAILAIPAHAAAPLLEPLAPAAAQRLKEIRYASTAVLTFGFSGEALYDKLQGNGFLVAGSEEIDITGCTFSSLKWENRAPEGTTLIRVFMGRDGGMNIDHYSDDELRTKAMRVLDTLFRLRAEPSYRRIDRWQRSMPQYETGHKMRVDAIEEAIGGLPIVLTGSSYRGTGIPDCIRQGRAAARRLEERMIGHD